MMIKIEFGFGIEFKGDGSGVWPEDLAQATIEIKQKAMTLYGGFTIFQTSGGWIDPDTGGPVLQVGRCLTVYTNLPPEFCGNEQEAHAAIGIHEMVECIRSSPLKQKSVAVCITKVTSSIFHL